MPLKDASGKKIRRAVSTRYPQLDRAIYLFKLRKMDIILKSYVNQLNYSLSEQLKSIGVENNPFLFVFNKRFVPYRTKNNASLNEIRIEDINISGQTYRSFKDILHDMTISNDEKDAVKKLPLRPISNVFLDLDPDFIDDYNNRKLGFFIWFNQKYPEEANKYYKKIIMHKETESKHDLFKYKQEFFKDEPLLEADYIKTKYPHRSKYIGMENKGGGTLLAGYTTGHAEISGKATRHIKTFTTRDLDRFLLGENDLFNDTHVENSNFSRYLKSLPSDESRRIISNVFKYILEEFRLSVINPDFEKLLNIERSKFDKIKKENLYKDNMHVMSKEYKALIKKTNKFIPSKYIKKPIVKREIKFPNIDNIRRWFISSGIYKSNFMQDLKYKEFNNKTMKGKISAINSAVFLIANGIYTRKTGEKTHFKQHGVLPPVALKTAGLKVSLKTALRLSRRNKYITNRIKRNNYIDAATRRAILALRRVREYNTNYSSFVGK